MNEKIDTRPLNGPILDFYGKWSVAVAQIGDTAPWGLKIQGWPDTQDAVIRDAKRRWPDALLALCPGVDPIAKRWRSHRKHDRAVAELVAIADGCAERGIGHLAWDAEPEWKGATVAERTELDSIASDAQSEVLDKHPLMRLYCTTYGWIVRVRGIGGHTMLATRGLLSGKTTLISQNYDRGPGNLIEGEATSIESFEALKATGGCNASTTRLVEVQTHHNTIAEIAVVGTSTDATFFWAAGSDRTFDANGAKGWRVAQALHTKGFWGHDCVRRFQTSAGLKSDGVVGPMTMAALGVR